MYLRHLFISGLLVGAAMFLPSNVFAEVNELSGPENSQKASSQVSPSVGIDNKVVKSDVPAKQANTRLPAIVKPDIPAKEANTEVPTAVKADVPAQEKAKEISTAVKANVPTNEKAAEVPSPAMKAQGKVKQRPSKVSSNLPASQKSASAAASQNLPQRAKGKVQFALNKKEKSVNKDYEPEKIADVPEHDTGLGKNKSIPKDKYGHYGLDPLHNSKTEMKKQVQSVDFDLKGTDIDLSVSKKENRSERFLQEPLEKGGISSDREKIPEASQMINPTQRTSSNGGPSNDRGSKGLLSTISFLDKWFIWNPYFEIELDQSYHFQQIGLNNQWVNAPPSPPPKSSSFLLNVYC